MARILVIGEGLSAGELVDELERDGHVVGAVAKPERGALEHVAIVCWLAEGSPERFLLGAVDSSMRGLVYLAGEAEHPEAGDWERSLLDTAARNAIPLAAVRADRGDSGVWLAQARAAVASLIDGPR